MTDPTDPMVRGLRAALVDALDHGQGFDATRKAIGEAVEEVGADLVQARVEEARARGTRPDVVERRRRLERRLHGLTDLQHTDDPRQRETWWGCD